MLGRNLPKLAIIAGVLVALIIVWMAWDLFTTDSPPKIFRTAELGHIFYDELLLLRRASPNGDLLLKISGQDPVYQYNLTEQSVKTVDNGTWLRSTEKITVCDQSISVYPRIAPQYKSYGKYVLSVAESRSGTKLAVISAYGPKLPDTNGFFFGGEGRIFGNRYFEVKSSPDLITIGRPIRLNVHHTVNPGICWTNDESLVIIYDPWSYSFSALDLGQSTATEEEKEEARASTMPVADKPDLSRLTGVVHHHGVDENGDGFFEKIAIDVETETSVPGTYNIFVGLTSRADGQFFGGSVNAQLHGGIESTPVYIDTSKWFDKKIHGSFSIDEVHLRYGRHPTLEIRKNLGETGEYKISHFPRPNIVFTGENWIHPIDRNGNGKYEGLKITVGVDALNPGEYTFQGQLYDEFSSETAAFYSGKSRLKKGGGEITFFFDGTEILDHGRAGRFRLKYVIIRNSGQPFSDLFLTTDSYDIHQFEASSTKIRPKLESSNKKGDR